MSEKTILVIQENAVIGIIKAAATCLLTIAVIGVGVWVGSSAMQWAGFVLLALIAIARASPNTKYKTREEAIRYLQEMRDE